MLETPTLKDDNRRALAGQIPAGIQPGVHRFGTAQHSYVLDINTNQIIEIDDIINELLGREWPIPPASLSDLEKKYSREALRARLRSMGRAREEKGVFLPPRVERIGPRERFSGLRRLLSGHLAHLELGITENCNLRCRYCVYSGKYRYARKRTANNMSFETARRAINYFSAHSRDSRARCISFYGGEPLLRMDFIRKCVRHAADALEGRKTAFGITSNGTLLTPEIVAFLHEHNFSLTISLDGPRDVHDANRVFANGRGCFSRVIENVKMICDLFPDFARRRLSFSAVIPPGGSMIEINRFFSEELPPEARGAPVVSGFVDPCDTTYFQEVGTPRWKEYGWDKLRQAYVDAILQGGFDARRRAALFPLLEQEMVKELGRLFRRGLFAALPKSVSPGGQCIPGVRKLFVSAEGKYYVCEKAEPRGEAARIGDVEHGVDAHRAWDLLASYVRLNAEECLSCWAIRLCSQCYVAAIMGAGLDAARKHQSCEGTRARIHEGLVLVASILERNEHALDFLSEVSFG